LVHLIYIISENMGTEIWALRARLSVLFITLTFENY